MARTQIGRIICRCAGVKQIPRRSSPAAQFNSNADSGVPAAGPKLHPFVQIVGSGLVIWWTYAEKGEVFPQLFHRRSSEAAEGDMEALTRVDNAASVKIYEREINVLQRKISEWYDEVGKVPPIPKQTWNLKTVNWDLAKFRPN